MLDLDDLLDPSHTAVVVVDVQNDFVHPDGKLAQSGLRLIDGDLTLASINRLVTAARGAGAHVVYVRVEHHPATDLEPYRAMYGRRGLNPNDLLCHAGSWGAELADTLLPPRPGEPVVVKRGFDAFYAPDLEPALARWRVKTVLVTGVVTNLCVQATVASAFERGYFPVVVRECTTGTDVDAVVHALQTVAGCYGPVVPLTNVLERWATPGRPISSAEVSKG